MLKRISVSLMLCAAFAFLLAACGKTETSNTGSTTNTTTTTDTKTSSSPAMTTDTKTSSSPAATTPASGEKVGVAECDEFLEKYEACVSGKVPAAARATYEKAIADWRKSWRDLAANPQTKGTLSQVCKQSLEQTKQSMSSFGCSF